MIFHIIQHLSEQRKYGILLIHRHPEIRNNVYTSIPSEFPFIASPPPFTVNQPPRNDAFTKGYLDPLDIHQKYNHKQKMYPHML